MFPKIMRMAEILPGTPVTIKGREPYCNDPIEIDGIFLWGRERTSPEVTLLSKQGSYHSAYSTYILSKDEVVVNGERKESYLRDYRKIERPEISYGVDPEFFVRDGAGAILPAFYFLPKRGRRIRSFWDGFAAEFTFGGGHYCLEMMSDAISREIRNLGRRARKIGPKAKLTLESVVEIPKQLLESADEAHVKLGCDPSLNVYGLKGKSILDGRKLNYRFAGGHLHFGKRWLTETMKTEIIKSLDAIVGVCGVSLAASFDTPIRRRYYGLAGEYRNQPWGLEYRVLSNFWLSAPPIYNLIWDLAKEAYGLGYTGFREVWKAEENEVIETINNCDVERARKIIKKNINVLKYIYDASYGGGITKRAISTVLNGIESLIKEPTEIEQNWRLRDNDEDCYEIPWRFRDLGRGNKQWTSEI